MRAVPSVAVAQTNEPLLYAGSGDRPPYALRAIVRFVFADCAFVAASVPALQGSGAGEILAFLTGLLWAVPVEHISAVLRRKPCSEGLAVYPTCAVRGASFDATEGTDCLIGTIEAIIE